MEGQKQKYALLSRFYGWNYNEIDNMTEGQIICALEVIEKTTKANENTGNPGTDGNLHFSTLDEWKMWKEMRG